MNLLVTGAWSDGKNCITELEVMGHTVVFMQYEKDELPCSYEWVEGVVCNGLFLSHPIEKFTNLRYIQLTSAGFDRVDMAYVKAHGIEIHNARGVYSIPGVLQLYKQAAFYRENQKRHLWEKHRGLLELAGKKVLIVGCGSVGNECTKRFKAFDCNITGVDLFPREDSLYSEILPLEKLDATLKTADIVVLTLPLTEQTRHLINDSRFSLLKDGAVLVNIARGAVVDTGTERNPQAADERVERAPRMRVVSRRLGRRVRAGEADDRAAQARAPGEEDRRHVLLSLGLRDAQELQSGGRHILPALCYES